MALLGEELNSINYYEDSFLSQNGEDGIIKQIFKRIGTTNCFFVEFGVEDGFQCNTANLAIYQSWTGIMIEGDKEFYDRLVVNYKHFPNVKLNYSFITKDNIIDIFENNNVPLEFDLLSIDIDGNDYWVWKALGKYKPRLVVIEYNAAYPPPIKWIMKYNADYKWDGTTYYGASLTSLCELGKELGYSLIGTESRGVNAFFLRSDLLRISGFKELSPKIAYHPPRYGQFFGGHPRRDD
jgi:hypothetical protein